MRGPVRVGIEVPRLNFNPYHVAILEGSCVAVRFMLYIKDYKLLWLAFIQLLVWPGWLKRIG